MVPVCWECLVYSIYSSPLPPTGINASQSALSETIWVFTPSFLIRSLRLCCVFSCLYKDIHWANCHYALNSRQCLKVCVTIIMIPHPHPRQCALCFLGGHQGNGDLFSEWTIKCCYDWCASSLYYMVEFILPFFCFMLCKLSLSHRLANERDRRRLSKALIPIWHHEIGLPEQYFRIFRDIIVPKKFWLWKQTSNSQCCWVLVPRCSRFFSYALMNWCLTQ